jgi:NADH:ubiquinone oxidoreductase subunit E
MIVGAIKKELTEDMTLTIKTICAILRTKFSGVNSFYSMIWRGREEATT